MRFFLAIVALHKAENELPKDSKTEKRTVQKCPMVTVVQLAFQLAVQPAPG